MTAAVAEAAEAVEQAKAAVAGAPPGKKLHQAKLLLQQREEELARQKEQQQRLDEGLQKHSDREALFELQLQQREQALLETKLPSPRPPQVAKLDVVLTLFEEFEACKKAQV